MVMVMSLQAVVALLCVVAAYIDICDAAAVVDVYRLIQYDLRGAPFGSRRAIINHHATSGLSVPGSDVSRQVVILPVEKVNITLLNGMLVWISLSLCLWDAPYLPLLPSWSHYRTLPCGHDNLQPKKQIVHAQIEAKGWVVKFPYPHEVREILEYERRFQPQASIWKINGSN